MAILSEQRCMNKAMLEALCLSCRCILYLSNLKKAFFYSLGFATLPLSARSAEVIKPSFTKFMVLAKFLTAQYFLLDRRTEDFNAEIRIHRVYC